MTSCNLPPEILQQIGKIYVCRSSTYARGARLCLVNSVFRDAVFLSHTIYAHWIQLDLKNKLPRFRVQAAIAGMIKPFQDAPGMWDGLKGHIPVGKLLCAEPGIRPVDYDVEQYGEESAYNMAVLNSTKERGTYNKNIDLSFPIFASKFHKNTYLNCLRSIVSRTGNHGLPGLAFIEILCILCGAGDSSGVNDNALLLLDMFLKHPPHNNRYRIPLSTWSLLCGPITSTPPSLLQRMWEHDSRLIDKVCLNDINYTNSREVVIVTCLYSLFQDKAANEDAPFDRDSWFAKALSWLCSTPTLREIATPFVLGRAICEGRSNVLEFVIEKYPYVTQTDVDQMVMRCQSLSQFAMADRLRMTKPICQSNHTRPHIWGPRFYYW